MENQTQSKWMSGWGCIVLLVIAALIFGLMGSPGCSLLTDYMGARRAESEAHKANAQAERLEAEIQMENAKTYNEASGRALKADTYRAHPELYLADAIRFIVLVGLGIAAAIAVYIAAYAWKKPLGRDDEQGIE